MMREPKVDIIAELGINHDGSYEKALRMIAEAQKAGVSIIKFQHYDAEKLLGKNSPYYEYANSCQFTKAQHERLKSFCDAVNMEYLVSVFDIADVAWADALCKRHKVASRMNKDNKFIQSLLETGKEVIISIQDRFPTADSIMAKARYMYCITKYPTLAEDLADLPCNSNLGLSSHCPDIKPTLKAISQGANLVEHHVTFSRDDKGCDHSSSITFDELKQLNTWANEMEVVE